MSTVRLSRDGLTLRFGDLDTPAPEGTVDANPPPRILVALSPVDSRTRVSVVVRAYGQERTIALRTGRRSRNEQFFEGSFQNLRGGDQIEYTVRAELERQGVLFRLDSSEVPGGVRRLAVMGGAPRRRDISAAEAAKSRTIVSPATGISDRVSARPTRPQFGSPSVVGNTARPARPELGSTGLVGTTARPAEPGGGLGGSSRRVAGTIALQHGSPAAGVKVRVYQRGFGGQKTLLREGSTDDKGGYDLAYETSGSANIEIHVAGSDGMEVQLSATKVGAGEVETIDLVAPSKLQPPKAEFTRLTAAVSPLLVGNPNALRDAVERGDRRDFTLLAGATSWDARLLALAAEAHTTAQKTAIPVDGAYGLARLGFPTEPSRLARVPRSAVESGLRRAADAGIIEDEVVARSIAAFETFAGEQRLLLKAPGALSNAKDFLGRATRITARDKAAFESVVRQEVNGDVWARAKEAGVSDTGVAALQLQGKLAYLTANNAELTEHLLGKVRSTPAELIGLGYYEEAAWQKTIREELARNDADRLDALIPPAFGGATPGERLGAYAEELARRVTQMDPHAVTLDRIAKDRLDGARLDAGVKAFLKNAAPQGFRLGETRLGAFMQGKEATLLPGMTDAQREKVLDDVRTLSALYAITPSDAILGALLAAGIKSATQVAEMRYPQLAKLIEKGAKDGDRRSSEMVHWKAQQVAATVYNVFDSMKRLPAALAQKPELGPDQRRVIKEKLNGLFPTLENLFGTVDFCACEECQSVLSPAAYMVDLLHFVDPKDWATVAANYQETHGVAYPHPNAPFFYLDERRPDLKDIPLTCENTNTALPYIDLVNEVLERVVADGGTGAIEAFDTGEASSQELVAEPQHIAWEAYVGGNGKKGLRDYVYPPALPFDLPLEMVRAFLKQLEIPLFRLRECVVRPSKLRASAGKADGLVDIWYERLGLGPYDVAVLTRKQGWHELFGYKDENDALKTVTEQSADGPVEKPALTSLGNGKTLARRLAVTYEELVEILRTRFVNPGIAERVVLDRLGIDVHVLDLHFDRNESLGELGVRLSDLGLKPNDLRPLRAAEVRQRTVVLRMPSIGCDFAEATLAFDVVPPNPDEAMKLTLLKMSVFVRLWRKLGWEVHELDRALMALVPGVDTPSFSMSDSAWAAALETALVYLAHVEELVERGQGRVTREDVLGFWTDIPTKGVASLYERLFESPAVLGQDPAFASRLGKVLAENIDNASRSLDIQDHVDTIRQALQLSHHEIEPILALDGAPNRKINIANLSTLRRHAVLAKLLSVSVAELIALLRLTEKKPLSKLDATPLGTEIKKDVPWTQTLAFVRELDALKAAGLDANAVERLCRHQGAPDEIPVESDPVLLALRALPAVDLDVSKEDPRKDERLAARLAAWTAARWELLPQTLAAQLAAPPAMVKRLLGVLRGESGKSLIEDGFGDDSAHPSSVRKLRKALDLVRTLAVTELELDHLLADPVALHPNDLPLAAVASDTAAQTTFKGLLRWIELAGARRRLGSSERLLAVLAAPKESIDARIALTALTGLPSDSIKTVLAALAAVEAPDLATPAGVIAFVDALAAFIRIGLDPASVVGWASATVDQNVAQKVRAAVKGRYSPSSWKRVAQPIFDALRKKQRDALVAHLTHVMEGNKPKYGDTQEKLFEHLLIDPGTEPVVFTSRVQLAISSVQQFVRRCLMGLEENVKPGIIDAKRWQWMQRYRVWEVNRKFFIWPENWLDPEFRDDKTHLFRELEGALLQGDIDDDLVRGALYKYLQGLEAIARLEMLTMYFESGISADGGTVHVIGRTQNAPYKYFHRSSTAGMWSPWEPIESGVEGDHLVLTAWRGRMHLFWLSFMEKPEENKEVPKELKPGDTVNLSNAKPTPCVQLQLHWVENIRGKWVNRSSTPTFEDALSFKGKKATTPDEKKKFFVHAKLVSVGAEGPQDDNLEIHVVHADVPETSHKFVLFSKLAPPRLESPGQAPNKPILSVISDKPWEATKWSGSGPLQVSFTGDQTRTSENGGSPTVESSNAGPHTVLGSGGDYRLLFPSNERLPEPASRIPAAVGTPSPVVFRPQDAVHIVYRGADRSIHDLWGDAIGWFIQSPSADAEIDPPNSADPEPARSDPHAYALDDRGLLCVVYAGETTVVELSWAQADAVPNDEAKLSTRWLATTIYETSNKKEYPVGRPLGGIFAPRRGAVFRTKSGRLLAQVEDGTGWKNVLLNDRLPAAASDPTGCLMTRIELGDTVVVSRHVIYVGEDGHVYELSSDASAAKWTAAKATDGLAAGDLPAPDASPSAYTSPSEEKVYVVYRAADRRLREIHRGAPARMQPRAPAFFPWHIDAIVPNKIAAKGHPVGFALERERTRHVIHPDEHGLHELRRQHRGLALILFHWTEHDAARYRPPDAKPVAHLGVVVYEAGNRALLCYADQNGSLHVLRYSDGAWALEGLALLNPFTDASATALATPFFYEAAPAAQKDHTFFVEPYVVETAVHEWTEWVVMTEEYVEASIPEIKAIPFIPDKITVKPDMLGIFKPERFGADALLGALVRTRGSWIGPNGAMNILPRAQPDERRGAVAAFDSRKGIGRTLVRGGRQ